MAPPLPNHPDDSTGRSLLVLKSPRYGPPNGDQRLPYRIDHLRACGFRLLWTDEHLDSRHRNVRERIEARTTPFGQLWAARRLHGSADAVLAMFESEGHALALARRLGIDRDRPLVVVACWLAEIAGRSPLRRRLYRQLYRGVDAVVVFSANQRAQLSELLGIPAERIHVLSFGVDVDEIGDLLAPDAPPGDVVLAAGRDRGRDWPTLVAAARSARWPVQLLTRPEQVTGLDLPPNVTYVPPVPRGAYLRMLSGAAIVVVPSTPQAYPTGQTVLLEAMAMGKACIVSDAPAMADYVRHEHTALVVPPGDPDALRAAVDRLLSDGALRETLGTDAREWARTHDARAMWASVGEVVDRLV